MKRLKCECGGALTLNTGYTGADWNCEAGNGSGYGYEISIDCNSCGAIYPIGHTKGINDLVPVIDKLKVVS